MRSLLALLVALFVVSLAPAPTAAQQPEAAKPAAGPALVPSPGAARAQPAPDAMSAWQRLWAPVLAAQAELHRALAHAVARIRTAEPFAATLFLATISFVYGVLHAAGPGHGKVVISSYVLANERTVRRGILLSFLAALVQALVAIALVVALSFVLRLTRLETRAVEPWLETLSWALVLAVGLWLLTDQLRRWRAMRAHAEHMAHHHGAHHHGAHHHGAHHHGPAHHHDHAHDHAHRSHAHAHHGHAPHHHDHTPGHGHQQGHGPGHDACCAHAHLPPPEALDGEWSWRRALSIALAVGIRPCTGAIAVLIFASSVGLFWAGVLSTFAMALGTAITVSALAALAVGSRELATRLFGGNGSKSARVRLMAAMAGSLVLILAGALFLIASLTVGPSGPV